MSNSSCENCKIRARYDNNPKSFLGKLWRWHADWCPGWKSYMRSLPDEERVRVAEKYSMKKYIQP